MIGECLVDRLRDDASLFPYTERQDAADLIEELTTALANLLDASERHIFADECLAQRTIARAVIAKATKP